MTNPDALLLLTTGCPHCPAVLEGLAQLLKQGRIGRLEAINLVEHPEAARQADARSVPWTRIGPFELEGLLSVAELARWTEFAQRGEGFAEYYSHLLETQRAYKVVALLQQRPESLEALLSLLDSDDTPMAARIGVGVVLEELRDSDLLASALPSLLDLAGSTQANIRADAAHFLGLSGSRDAIPRLRELLTDDHPDVREIAADSLKTLGAAGTRDAAPITDKPQREHK